MVGGAVVLMARPWVATKADVENEARLSFAESVASGVGYSITSQPAPLSGAALAANAQNHQFNHGVHIVLLSYQQKSPLPPSPQVLDKHAAVAKFLVSVPRQPGEYQGKPIEVPGGPVEVCLDIWNDLRNFTTDAC